MRKRIPFYLILFAISLLCLLILGIWWSVFFQRSIQTEYKAKLSGLSHAAVVSALILGHKEEAPQLGVIEGPVPLEVVSVQDQSVEFTVACIPNHPEFAVRPQVEAIAKVKQKVLRRQRMANGEAALLFILIFICCVMFLVLVWQQRRQAARNQSFVSSVTHEMKTPLTGIKSLLQTFQVGRIPEEQIPRLCKMGIKEAERLEHMIENMLISGRLRNKDFNIKMQEVALRDVITNFVEHRKRYLIDNPQAIQLKWEIRQPDAFVRGDVQAITTILENFADNAFKYGGDDPDVTVGVRELEDSIEIYVQDTGIGFKPDNVDKLFIPFTRGKTAQEYREHGTGLGLSISATLAQKMRSNIRAYSAGPGQGSKFSLFLQEIKK